MNNLFQNLISHVMLNSFQHPVEILKQVQDDDKCVR